MKKRNLLILSSCLLFSCASQNAPQEIVSYINNCSISKAFEATTKIEYDFSSSLYEKEKLIGQTRLVIHWDNSDKDDFKQTLKETYTGTNISYDEEKKLYITSKVVSSYFDKKDSLYHKITCYTGYEKKEDKDDLKTITYSDVKYQKSQFNSEKEVLFRSQTTSGISKGGVYYADFFSNLLSYYPYMSIENGLFTYTLKDYPYKSDTEEGIINETVHMNELGLLVDLYQDAKNTKTEKTSILDVTVTYNSSEE